MAALSPEQVKLVKATVPVLQAHGTDITTHFYATMLEENPALRGIFNKANQANNHQASALASALYASAANIDDLGALSPTVEKICHKHASLHIQPEQYKIVGTYLLRAMAEVLGTALAPEVLEAWTVAYWQLVGILTQREKELYEQADGWTDWRDFRIVRKVRESCVITSFYLEPVDGHPLPSFLPGQYISVSTDVPALQHRQSRQYSLSDAPNPNYYRISVKREDGMDPTKPDSAALPGCISNVLHDEKEVGNVLQVGHPHGDFFLDPTTAATKPTVLLSAGVGITPQVAIANTLTRSQSEQQISFIHGSRSSASRAFYEHVQGLADRHSNVKYTTFVKDPETVRNGESTACTFKGRLSLDLLDGKKDLFLDNESTEYFVCGPEGFMMDMEEVLLKLGVDSSRIHVEIFGTGMPTRS